MPKLKVEDLLLFGKTGIQISPRELAIIFHDNAILPSADENV